ncbi:MAG: c-type cytochrome [Caulobacterales bacterium]
MRELVLATVLAFALAGCAPRDQPRSARAPAVPVSYAAPPVSHFVPGELPPPPEDPRGAAYDGNPQAIADGKRYFAWYNCGGCHFNGGGGIGPALMDQQWIYGGRIDEIHNSIAQGRPNGMPTWQQKIPDEQIWEIAAYVRSLSAPSTINQGKAKPDSPPPPVANHPAAG